MSEERDEVRPNANAEVARLFAEMGDILEIKGEPPFRFNAYRTGARKSPQMAAMSDVLTDQDIGNVAAYYTRQKARGLVFVILPSKPGTK